jgi:hypothetical protein
LLTNGFLLLKMAYFTFCPPFCEFFTEMSSFFSLWIWQPYFECPSVLEKLEATWGFILWFSLNWGIDYWIKTKKLWFERINFRINVHPSAHCVMISSTPKMLDIFWSTKHKQRIRQCQ